MLNRTYVRTNYIGVVRIVDESATIQKKLENSLPAARSWLPAAAAPLPPRVSPEYIGALRPLFSIPCVFPNPVRFFGVCARPGKNPAR